MEQIIKNPEIERMDKEGAKYKMYVRLYQSFFNAQIQKSPSYPLGVEEGDQTSIRIHNTAFNLADIIGDSIEFGVEGADVDISDLIKKSGDAMIGELKALNGFKAGISGREAISIYQDKEGYLGVDIYGTARIDGNLLLNGKDVLSRDAKNSTTKIEDDHIIIESGSVELPENTKIGEVSFKDGDIISGSNKFYHTKNANLVTIDWLAKNLIARGTLNVSGKSSLKDVFIDGEINIKDAIYFKNGGSVVISPDLNLNNSLSFNGKKVIIDTKDHLSIGNNNGILVIGTSETKELRIAKPIKTWNGSRNIITESGAGNFTEIKVGLNSDNPLIKTSETSGKEGVIFSHKVWLGGENGLSLYSTKGNFTTDLNGSKLIFDVIPSDSLHKPKNKESKSIIINNDCDFLISDKPIEAKTLNIRGSETYLSDGVLYLTKTSFIESTKEDILIHGLVRLDNNLSSQKYSSGYGGFGWGIQTNKVSGVTSMSIDEMTIRKKMRIYELEVNKVTATNGSLWVSDSMKADIVEQIIY